MAENLGSQPFCFFEMIVYKNAAKEQDPILLQHF
jgi:hypothetical protein